MTISMDFVAKGIQVSRVGLLDQALYHRALEAKYRAALQRAGWASAHSVEFIDCFEYLKTHIHDTADARAESKTDREVEQEAISDAKAFKRKLLLGFMDLSAERRVLAADYDLVRKSGRLARSTPKILGYFAKIRGQIEKYDSHLAPYFDGASALSIFDRVRSNLENAQSKQELNLKALPQKTLKIYETMGRLLMLIEKMNRAGKIAFDGEAHIIGEFNKDLLNRARQKRRAVSTVETVAEAGEGEVAEG